MSLPTPDEAAKAFLASPEYSEHWAGITRAVGQDPTWAVTSYEQYDPSVSYRSVVGVGDRCDLFVDEVFGKEPDPGHEKRKAAVWLWVAIKLLGLLLDGPYVLFWHRVWPHERRPRDRWDADEHNHKVALIVREDVFARLGSEAFAGWRANLFDLLASPEVRAESDSFREQHALSELDGGVGHLRKLGWSDEAILSRVQQELST